MLSAVKKERKKQKRKRKHNQQKILINNRTLSPPHPIMPDFLYTGKFGQGSFSLLDSCFSCLKSFRRMYCMEMMCRVPRKLAGEAMAPSVSFHQNPQLFFGFCELCFEKSRKGQWEFNSHHVTPNRKEDALWILNS